MKYHKEEDDHRITLLLSIIDKASYKDYLTVEFSTLANGQMKKVKDILDKFNKHYKAYHNTTQVCV